MYSHLVTYLFETRAIRVCPKDKLFWYTSGKIGPYYINTISCLEARKRRKDSSGDRQPER